MASFCLPTTSITFLSYTIKTLTAAALAAVSWGAGATPWVKLGDMAYGVPAQERSIGRGVEALIEERGKPTNIVEGGGGPRFMEYGLPGCKQRFVVWRELVLSGSGTGSKCKTDFPDSESLEIASIPGEVRYDGPMGLDVVGIRAANRFTNGDYAAVDRLFSEMKNPQMRLNDGRWMAMGLETFGHEYRRYMDRATAYQKIQEWKEANPQSAGAAIFESMYWQAAAWEARGHGYASSVSREGWQLFAERMAKAEAALRAAEPFGREHPTWYSEYLKILHYTGQPKEELLAFFEQAKTQHPGYHDFYFIIIYALTPRWGGNYRLAEWLVRVKQRGVPP